ncbi:Tat binding protein 1(TBP-1)-interacting protein (TBPIP)-domain containing protein [Rhodotorula toruloides]|uniref:Tat binding protein 1(TBP-1)-interacting protein (TBPIP)-domain containing protein n=1 Tax=Rhodotorula toruloides TaxID=5286 RepID=A0A2T0AJ60_RHOTO|nr:Tat binding protein 1(TBP-1)-interacting protein (TBPIP)-domain containing protein [Rhodotorula toruloides]
MPPKEKVVSAKGDEAEELVLSYLIEQNRPYGATDISANLKNRVSKPQTQKALASLFEKGEIGAKTFGKTTVYCPLQARPLGGKRGAHCGSTLSEEGKEDELTSLIRSQKDEDPNEAADGGENLDAQIKALREEEEKLKEEVKVLAVRKAEALKTPRNSDLSGLVASLEAKCASLTQAIAARRAAASSASSNPSATLSASALSALSAQYTSLLTLALKRRKICLDIEGMLMEGFDKKKGQEEEVWEEVGGEFGGEEEEETWKMVKKVEEVEKEMKRKAKMAAAAAK